MKLKLGEVLCPDCKDNHTWFCFRCGGTGKIDWVDLCMGKKTIWASLGKNPCSTITLPIMRKMYPKLIAKELVSVQPIDWIKK